MRWSEEQACQWHREHPWLCGFNYLPGSAVNSTEMWQAGTFDAPAMRRELAWAKNLGFNTVRVFLQYLVWEQEGGDWLGRFDQFLEIASACGMGVMPVLFDDCAFSGKQPFIGPQGPPLPGIHNSCWTPSPGHRRVVNREAWPSLQAYVTAVVGRFARDERIVCWDLYNEPGNTEMGDQSLPLLQAVFEWVWEISPMQPLTAATWNDLLVNLNRISWELSDLISFHHYRDLESLRLEINELRRHGRPILCSEWMARPFQSTFDSHLPFFKEEKIGCWFWGLVRGRTQTCYPWGAKENDPLPELWFHDLLDTDGTPFRDREIAVIKQCTLGDDMSA